MSRSIIINDRMQRNYRYELVVPIGRNFDPEFNPDLTPAEMLRLGVFGGKYMTDCRDEFPVSWFKQAKLATSHAIRHSTTSGWMPASRSGMAQERLDPSRRSARLVPVVLPLLHGSPDARRGRAADQALESHSPPCAAVAACVRSWRFVVPPASAASFAALGI